MKVNLKTENSEDKEYLARIEINILENLKKENFYT